jgi:hypothetical protein
MANELPRMLGDKQYKQLILNFLAARGDEGADEEEIFKVLNWAEYTEFNHNCLELLLKGRLLVNLTPGQKAFNGITWLPTQRFSEERVRKLQQQLAQLDAEE